MKVINGSAPKKVLWVLSLGLMASFCALTTSGCFGSGDKKDKAGEEVGPDDAGTDAPKKDKKKGKKDKKHKDDKKKKDKTGDDAAAKDPM